MLLTTEVVPKIFPNLNVVAHLVVPAEAGYFFLFFFFCFWLNLFKKKSILKKSSG